MRLACLPSLLTGGCTYSGAVAILADAGIQHVWPSKGTSGQQLSRDLPDLRQQVAGPEASSFVECGVS